VTIFRDDGVRCVDAPLHEVRTPRGQGVFLLEFPIFSLQGGSYDTTVAVYDAEQHRFHEFRDRLYPFAVRDPRSTGGVAWMDYSWKV
jgi:hypothetical protein